MDKSYSESLPNCVYYSVGDKPYKFSEIQWLGFDKYKKLIYGIIHEFPTDLILVKFSVFGKKISRIKKLIFPIFEHWRNEKVVSFKFSSAMNDAGDYIGVLNYLSDTANLMSNRNLELYLFMINLESLQIERYHINLLLRESNNMTVGSLFYSPHLKWVVSLHQSFFSIRESFYQLIIDRQNLNDCRLRFLTSMPQTIVASIFFNKICIDNRIFIFTNAANCHIYDMLTDRWTQRYIGGPENVKNFNDKKYVVVVDKGYKRYFAIPREPEPNDYFLTLNEKDADANGQWKWTNSLYQFNRNRNENSSVFPVYGFCCEDLFFINAQLRNIDRSAQSNGLHLIVVANNVLSLQDLAMKRLCDLYRDYSPLTENRNAAILNIPTQLIRTYLGLEWSLKKFHSTMVVNL